VRCIPCIWLNKGFVCIIGWFVYGDARKAGGGAGVKKGG
jgi:hypothetical protein